MKKKEVKTDNLDQILIQLGKRWTDESSKRKLVIVPSGPSNFSVILK